MNFTVLPAIELLTRKVYLFSYIVPAVLGINPLWCHKSHLDTSQVSDITVSQLWVTPFVQQSISIGETEGVFLWEGRKQRAKYAFSLQSARMFGWLSMWGCWKWVKWDLQNFSWDTECTWAKETIVLQLMKLKGALSEQVTNQDRKM